jgi:cation:H+ antiporter
MTESLLYPIAALVGGFVLLVWGADKFVHGAAATARHLGVPPMIIGLTIVGFGTSAPEILVSVMAAAQGNPSLAVGNALGSNIANIGLVLGITALVTPLLVRSETLRREYPVMFAVMLVSLVLLVDGRLSRLDGVVLLAGLALMLLWLIALARQHKLPDPIEREYTQQIPVIPLGRALFWLVVGLALLLVSSRVLVWGAINIAQWFGVSDLIIGLTVVAIGTSLPELAASVVSALKKEPDLAIGNVLGSNMFNLLAVLGLPGVIAPLNIDPEVLQRDYPFMIGLSIAMFSFAYGFRGRGRINRLEGALLLAGYIAYIVVLFIGLR